MAPTELTAAGSWPSSSRIRLSTSAWASSVPVGPKLNWVTAISTAAAYRGGSRTDWRLPAQGELYNLYLDWARVGDAAGDVYWSSTELDANEAWVQFFAFGGQGNFSKDDTYYVWPVRAF